MDREAMNDRPTIIEAAATPEQARRVYDLWSHFYGWWAPLFEAEAANAGRGAGGDPTA